MANKVEFAPQTVEKQKTAIEKLDLAVGSTLGPRGFFVQFMEDGQPTITNDGVTVARNFELEDTTEQAAVELVRQASIETNYKVGDGTTAAIVLTKALIDKGWELMEKGKHPYEVKLAFDRISALLQEKIPALSTEAKDEATLVAVASLAANNDKSIGEPVGKLALEVGEEGTMYIDENDKAGVDTELIEGYSFSSGVASPYFLMGAPVATISQPSILLYDGKLVSGRDMVNFLEKMSKAGVERLVIICREIDGEALKVAATNKVSNEGFDVTVINAPGYAKLAVSGYLQDLAVLTGAKVLSEEGGVALMDVNVQQLGACESVSTRMDKTLMLLVETDGKEVEEHIAFLKSQLPNHASDEYAKTLIEARIEQLSQKTGVVKIGSDNPVSLRDMQFRADDAIHAAIAAFKSGVVAGGGTTLARIAWADYPDMHELDAEIIKVLDAPFKRIITNANKVPADVIENLGENEVWDVTTDEYHEPKVAGIIDPTDVVLTAVTQALDIAGKVITTSAVISKQKKEGK